MKIIKLLSSILCCVFAINSALATEFGLGGQYVTTIPIKPEESFHLKETQVLFQMSFFDTSPIRLYMGLGAGYGTLTLQGKMVSKDDNVAQVMTKKGLTYKSSLTEKNRISGIVEIGPEFRLHRSFCLQVYYGIDASISGRSEINQDQNPNSSLKIFQKEKRTLYENENIIKNAAIMFNKIGFRTLSTLANHYFDFIVGGEYITVQEIQSNFKKSYAAFTNDKMTLKPTSGSQFQAFTLFAGLRFHF